MARVRRRSGIFCGIIQRVRVYIFLGMLFVLLLAETILVQNSYNVAFNRAIANAEQSHLVIAENLASTLERYAVDVRATFDFVMANDALSFIPGSMDALLDSYQFRMLAVFDFEQSSLDILYSREFDAPSQEIVAHLREIAVRDSSNFSGVRQSPFGPVIYIARVSEAGALLVGAVDTSFVISQQSEIAFGERGHAMIVDNKGRVLAHPKQEWVDTSKDVTGLEVVQRMTSGQTGAMQFYAPPLKADVIAGFTFVPSTGWGAMVPQPVSELEEAARLEANELLEKLLLLLLFAALVSWFLSGLIARPIQSISKAATKVRSGDLAARVPEFKCSTPKELINLRFVFNGLLDNWSENRVLLESSLEAAKEANRRKSQSISVLSHEMRTPLNGVIGAVELLERTELTDLQKKYLGYVSTSSNTLLKHVNDVLKVSKLDSSKVILEKELVNLRDLMSDIVQENSAQVEQSGGRITLTFAPNTPLEVETEPRLLKTIVANLVGNAVKFAAGEKISISVEHVSIGTLEFTIKDSGPGIQSSDFESVFEPFTVLDASYGRHSEGTGLGLSIVATSVEALGGQIELHSEFGNGCEFRVQIPIDLPEGCSEFTTRESLKATSLRNNPEPTKNKERKKVLVVDDNKINRLLLTDMLQGLGHSVSEAEDGSIALEAAMNERFDLILMDISMPYIDGTEVSRRLRESDGPNRTTKIIAQTAHASPNDQEKIFSSGMQGVLTKPISIEALQSNLATLAEKEKFFTFDNLAYRSVFETEKLKGLVRANGVGPTDLVLDELLDEATSIILRLKSCDASHYREKALKTRVHNAVGACASLGANALHRSFRKIEDCLKNGTLSSSRDLLDTAERSLVETRYVASNLMSQLRQAQ